MPFDSVNVFFKDILLCCSEALNDAHSDSATLTQNYPLKLLYALPTNQLSVMHCIDLDHFDLKWGIKSKICFTFYPEDHGQCKQWVGVLRPFVFTAHYSTTMPQYIDNYHGASLYCCISFLVAEEYPLDLKPQTRPWCLIYRKGAHSENSSVIAQDLNYKSSALSPNFLLTPCKDALMRSALGLSFREEDSIPPKVTTTESLLDIDSNTLLIEDRLLPFALPDLTESVVKDGPFAVAHGEYSDIWTGIWKKDSAQVKVVIKVLRVFTTDSILKENLVKRELRIWSRLKHPHILELCGTVSSFGPYLSMVCPWMKNGSITKYLENSGDLLSLENRLKLIVEIANGLCYLHSCSVVHGDLTGSNVLIDDNLHARLCDFGLSTLLPEEFEDSLPAQLIHTSHLGGSVRWADACLFRSFEDDIVPPLIGTWNDIYSFGSIILEVLSGRLPYHYLRTDAQVVIQLHKGIRPRRPASTFMDDDQWELIQSCWQEPPQKRPSADQVLAVARGLVAPWTRKQ